MSWVLGHVLAQVLHKKVHQAPPCERKNRFGLSFGLRCTQKAILQHVDRWWRCRGDRKKCPFWSCLAHIDICAFQHAQVTFNNQIKQEFAGRFQPWEPNQRQSCYCRCCHHTRFRNIFCTKECSTIKILVFKGILRNTIFYGINKYIHP